MGFDVATALKLVEWVLLGLGTISAALHIVAPATITKRDDSVLNWVDQLADKLKRVVVPKALNKPQK